MEPEYVSVLPAVPPINPSKSALRRFDFILNATGWLGRIALRRFVKHVEVNGLEHLQGGNKLVLMNHSSPLDPILLTFYARKSFQFLVTEPYMAERKLAQFAAWMGQIPKRKLDPDIRAIRTLDQWCKVGGTIATFPEGQFSWDGNPLPLMPGLADLIKFLNVPVVTVRLINADRLWPAWAIHPRKTSLRFEVDPPKLFTPGEAIEEHIAKRLFVDPKTCARWPVTGEKLAEGMAKFLRFCFSCGADAALKDEGNELSCSACKRSWEVTGENRLLAKGDLNVNLSGNHALSVAEAWANVRKVLKDKWGTALPTLQSKASVTLMDASRSQWTHVAEGSLELQNGILTLGSWTLDLKDMHAHTMDWGDLILIRTERKRFAIRFPKDSRAVWTFALDESRVK